VSPCRCSSLLGRRVATSYVRVAACASRGGWYSSQSLVLLLSVPHVTLPVSCTATLCVAGPAKKKLGIQQKKKAMKSKSETYKIYSALSAPPDACFPAPCAASCTYCLASSTAYSKPFRSARANTFTCTDHRRVLPPQSTRC